MGQRYTDRHIDILPVASVIHAVVFLQGVGCAGSAADFPVQHPPGEFHRQVQDGGSVGVHQETSEHSRSAAVQ